MIDPGLMEVKTAQLVLDLWCFSKSRVGPKLMVFFSKSIPADGWSWTCDVSLKAAQLTIGSELVVFIKNCPADSWS